MQKSIHLNLICVFFSQIDRKLDKNTYFLIEFELIKIDLENGFDTLSLFKDDQIDKPWMVYTGKNLRKLKNTHMYHRIKNS